MYAAHFGAGLAIKSRFGKAPTLGLLTGAFLLDFIWIAMVLLGVEKVGRGAFFDDWSHSFAMAIVWSSLFAAMFLRSGKKVIVAMWLAVFSHFLLDLPIHPKDLALYPHSSIHLGLGLWSIGRLNYWLAELVVLVVLMAVYVKGARKTKLPAIKIAGTCVLLLALHARFFL
jgi:hypothetical protein